MAEIPYLSLRVIHERDLDICEYGIFANATPECTRFPNQNNLRALAITNKFESQTDHSRTLLFGNAAIRE